LFSLVLRLRLQTVLNVHGAASNLKADGNGGRGERFMKVDHEIIDSQQTDFGGQNAPPQQSEGSLENELENRIRNLDKLAESIHSALGEETFSGKPHALDLANDVRLKIKASWKMFRVAKLLSEPARESMLLKMNDSVSDLEDAVATHFGVEMT
jgi:hypothetical protein